MPPDFDLITVFETILTTTLPAPWEGQQLPNLINLTTLNLMHFPGGISEDDRDQEAEKGKCSNYAEKKTIQFNLTFQKMNGTSQQPVSA